MGLQLEYLGNPSILSAPPRRKLDSKKKQLLKLEEQLHKLELQATDKVRRLPRSPPVIDQKVLGPIPGCLAGPVTFPVFVPLLSSLRGSL